MRVNSLKLGHGNIQADQRTIHRWLAGCRIKKNGLEQRKTFLLPAYLSTFLLGESSVNLDPAEEMGQKRHTFLPVSGVNPCCSTRIMINKEPLPVKIYRLFPSVRQGKFPIASFGHISSKLFGWRLFHALLSSILLGINIWRHVTWVSQ